MPSDSLLAVFIFSYIASFGAVISPGPVTAAILSESPKTGWKVGPLIASGHSLLELIIVIQISLGLSSGLTGSTPRMIIAIAGGLVLLFLGGGYLQSALSGRIDLPKQSVSESRESSRSLVMLGILTTISNPFWYTWWVTVAAGYLAQAWDQGAVGVAVFYLGHISADFSWDTFLSTTFSAGRRWLTTQRYRGLVMITGVFMVYLGILFLRSGLFN